jgi:demethylmenaquinone methyltransferase / 2-methoxy-6-polyprenyl-1,4-benzoquinol methylase
VTKKKLNVTTIVGTADAIPLENDRFDFLTMGYALRHVESLEKAFKEYFRVLKPGGRVLLLEITKPANRFAAAWFKFWFRSFYPAFTRVITGSREAQEMMRYYWETMDIVVPPEAIVAALKAAGFEEPKRYVLGGIFSEYSAVKPASAQTPRD